MGQLLLITLIGALVITVLLVPVSRKIRKGVLTTKQMYVTTAFVFIVSFISVFFVIYVSKMDSLYKGLLKNYSVEITDNLKKDKSSKKTFEKIFLSIETYVSEILRLPMGYVRASSKDHGRQNKIEGKLEKGQKVVVIEDLISTGGSVIEVVDAKTFSLVLKSFLSVSASITSGAAIIIGDLLASSTM